ncbi:hypothetical protein SB48_HM08orf05031 [Heyndrickxia coagulans]|uniref:Uncharacterized protein n=1 Tax=Heyndrickxia coagulans TaxID=1398 RepID=A0AAN0WD95_HEYCO|nr:hypothetical protein SB48_HM08orf05031 [Heyndrickxia coagulans]
MSFIPLMKDISDCGSNPFVLHSTYEGHFSLQFAYFCPSSRL